MDRATRRCSRQWARASPAPRVSWLVAVMDAGIYACELLLRLRKRNAIAQTGEDAEVSIGIRVGEGLAGEQRLCAEGKPNVWTLVDPCSEKAPRHDADDHKWLVLDGERAADEGLRVREGARPEAMAEDDRHAGGAGVLIC